MPRESETDAELPRLVAPATCRLWSGHAYQPPDAAARELLASLRRQGRQEIPAIVRRLDNDPTHAFEIICGARRHWAVGILHAQDSGFRFLIEPRRLSDEQAFRLAEAENRHRRNRPDHLRAAEYAHAITAYYEGSQSRMASRLGISQPRLSRFLALARLPDEIVACLGGAANLRVGQVELLAPLLRVPRARAAMIEAACGLTHPGFRPAHPHAAADLVRQLAEAGRGALGRRSPTITIRGEDGFILARGRRNQMGSLVINVPIAGTRNRPQVLAALAALLDQAAGPAEPARK